MELFKIRGRWTVSRVFAFSVHHSATCRMNIKEVFLTTLSHIDTWWWNLLFNVIILRPFFFQLTVKATQILALLHSPIVYLQALALVTGVIAETDSLLLEAEPTLPVLVRMSKYLLSFYSTHQNNKIFLSSRCCIVLLVKSY